MAHSTKSAPSIELSLPDRLRVLIAAAFDVESVRDQDRLDQWPSLDFMEAVVACERHLGLGETDEDRLMKCETVGHLVAIFNVPISIQEPVV